MHERDRKRTANGRQDGGDENVIGDSDISVAGELLQGRRGMCVWWSVAGVLAGKGGGGEGVVWKCGVW